MSRLTVLVDGVAFENPTQIGVWRVFHEVMRRTTSDVDYVLLLQNDAVQPIPEGVTARRWLHRETTFAKRQFVHNWKRRKAISSLEADFPNAIWHSTFFTLDPRRHGRNVVTVYDCISERFFYLNRTLIHQTETKRNCLRQANHVLAISESTHRDVVRFYPSLESKVTTTLLGSEHLLGDSNAIPTKQPFCLFVGHRCSYKNFLTVIDAINDPSWPERVRLHVVGQPFSEDEQNLLRYKNVESRISHLGLIDDEALKNVFAQAACFVFPSFCEGFGLPIIESQSCGTIPVLSDIPVFHEIAGTGAVFFDPTSAESLALAVARAVQPSSMDSILDAAAKNATSFSWDHTALKTLQCYRELRSL